MKKLIENYIIQTFGERLIHDLKLVLGERFNLLDMINHKTILHPDSEMMHRKDELLSQAFSRYQLHLTENINDVRAASSTRVIFINGIATTHYVAYHQARMLSQAIDQDVELVYNQTEGVFRDLLECNEGRYGVLNEEAKKAIETIKRKLASPGPLTIVAYSQGAIIATSALRYLAKQLDESQLSRIYYVTFGAGFKSNRLPDCITSEHFANTRDPVTKLGLQHPDYPCAGSIYLRQAKGHMFIADYLIPMQQGHCYGASQFQRWIKTTTQAG